MESENSGPAGEGPARCPAAGKPPGGRRAPAIAAMLLGALVAAIDFHTGPRIHLSALFLLPVGLGAWLGGRGTGLVLAFALPLVRPLLLQVWWEAGPAESTAWANAAIRIAAFSLFAELIHRVAAAARWRSRILECLPLGMWVVDRGGRVVMANPAALEIWGGNPFSGPVTEEGLRMWFHATGREISPWDWALVRALLDGEATRDEVLDIERPDRSRRTVSNTAVPLRDERGRIAGALLLQEDRTLPTPRSGGYGGHRAGAARG